MASYGELDRTRLKAAGRLHNHVPHGAKVYHETGHGLLNSHPSDELTLGAGRRQTCLD